MSKDLDISRLCDAYGALLTENMRLVVRGYYDFDMSLAELASENGVTRQAVLGRLRKAENKLREYERTFGFVKKTDELTAKLKQLEDLPEAELRRGLREVIAELE